MGGPSNPRNDKINDEKVSLFSFPPSNLRRLEGFSFVCVFFLPYLFMLVLFSIICTCRCFLFLFALSKVIERVEERSSCGDCG
jgi:hypothetical protein